MANLNINELEEDKKEDEGATSARSNATKTKTWLFGLLDEASAEGGII